MIWEVTYSSGCVVEIPAGVAQYSCAAYVRMG
jgi:hypothetical protein